ncbi:MAG: response regulator [Anaerolineae bacterium]
MTPIRVLIVDDHTIFRQGLVNLLQIECEFEVIGDAPDGEAALGLARKLHPDVVLMDVNMPRMGGIEATRRLLADAPGVQVLMLTVSEEDEDLFGAVRAGARGYILKNADANELLEAIRRVHVGEAMVSPAMTLRLLEALHDGWLPSIELPLTPRELDVFRLLGRGASNREIAETLLISENTVKTHVRQILRKLEVRSRHEVAAYARRLNLIS